MRSDDEVRLHAIVRGRVQGVNFRWYTRLRAQELGLVGFVRNKWDGTVEVVAEGLPEAVEELLSFIKIGPPAARVDGVDTRRERATGEFEQFEVSF